MHQTLEKFYKAVLSYAGTSLKDNIIVNDNPKLGDVKIDEKHLTLPYFENLRNPGDKYIFHPLNENFATPENAHFNLYKKKLTFELNMRLSTLIISLLKVGSEPLVQQRLKSEEAINLVSSLGEVDITTVEHFVGLVKASQAENNAAFLFDIYLKKNGSIGDTAYLAIGKINFIMYRELQKALEDKEKGYKVFGYKLRKKDIISLLSAFEAIFPNIGKQEDFTIGTDNKVFRYFSALLLASYPVAYRLNEVANLLEEAKDPSLSLEDVKSDLGWSNIIQDLYPLTDVIREIPNQTSLKTEAHQLAVDESKVKEAQRPAAAPVYSPPAQPAAQPAQVQTQTQPVAMVPQQPQQPSPEDIIRGSLTAPMVQPGMVMTPQGPMMMQQGAMQPGMMGVPQTMGVPAGMVQVMTPQGPVLVPQQPTMMQQGTVVGGAAQPGMTMTGGWTSFSPNPQPQVMGVQSGYVMTPQGPMMVQPGMMQPGMMPSGAVMVQPGTPVMGTGQGGGIPLNPHLMGGGGGFR